MASNLLLPTLAIVCLIVVPATGQFPFTWGSWFGDEGDSSLEGGFGGGYGGFGVGGDSGYGVGGDSGYGGGGSDSGEAGYYNLFYQPRQQKRETQQKQQQQQQHEKHPHPQQKHQPQPVPGPQPEPPSRHQPVPHPRPQPQPVPQPVPAPQPQPKQPYLPYQPYQPKQPSQPQPQPQSKIPNQGIFAPHCNSYCITRLMQRIAILEKNVLTGAVGGCESGVLGPFTPGRSVGQINFRGRFTGIPAVSLSLSDITVNHPDQPINFMVRPSCVTSTNVTVKFTDVNQNLAKAYVSYMACPGNNNRKLDHHD